MLGYWDLLRRFVKKIVEVVKDLDLKNKVVLYGIYYLRKFNYDYLIKFVVFMKDRKVNKYLLIIKRN